LPPRPPEAAETDPQPEDQISGAASNASGAGASGAAGGGSLRTMVRRLFGMRNGSGLRESLEELIQQEDVGETPATSDELMLLRNILKLHGLTVYDVMVPRADIIAVDAETSLEDLVGMITEEAHSRMPVYRGTLDEVVGMVHIKDVLAAWARDRDGAANVKTEALVRKLLFVAPSMPILELLLQMRVSRIHMALVVDEFGGVDGLATIEDLVEEIIGEIEDEHDEDEAPVMTPRPDGALDADARVELSEFEAWSGPVLTPEEREEDIDTLGGFVAFLAGRVPVRGEVIRHSSGVEFEIRDADPRRIRRMRISNLPAKAEEE
jgi:magnesium and cobalt transporter